MTEYKVEEHESFIGIMLVWVSRVDMVCFVKEVLNSDFWKPHSPAHPNVIRISSNGHYNVWMLSLAKKIHLVLARVFNGSWVAQTPGKNLSSYWST